MGFYDEISKYYDDIFKDDKETVDFLAENSGKPPKSLLDIACGTGSYSLELAKIGYDVSAIDLDNKMIEQLKIKAKRMNIQVKAVQGNMLETDEKINGKFDLIFCIGNSLVHLDGEEEIEIFLKKVKYMLKEKGRLIIQIINYDRILDFQVSSLPIIKNRGKHLEFQRIYSYDKGKNKIYFKTVLKAEGRTVENEIILYPLRADNLVYLLKKAGFTDAVLYGDMRGRTFNKSSSYSLVVSAS